MDKTILITGGTGYIGSWVTKMLLEKAYTVRICLRNKNKKNKYQHLFDIEKETPGKLEIFESDLLKKGSYDQAAEGSEAIIHIASPFTLRFKDAQKDLIEPALKGTENVLDAASKSSTVKKVILTSSVAAVLGDNYDMKELGITEFTEEHFNYSSSAKHQPYSYSKVLAEKKAWEMHKVQNKWDLVVINPSFVMGPALGKFSDSESLQFMKDMLTGTYLTGAPDLVFGFVDVRDVARAHILALENDKAKGRHILAERVISVYDFSRIIKQQFGNKYKLPLMKAPKLIMYFVGWLFGLTIKFISRNVGHPMKLNTNKSKEGLNLTYTPIEQSIEDMINQMHDQKIVN